MKRSVCTIALLFLIGTLFAQLDATYNQYWAMPSFYNAAAVGHSQKLNIGVGGRLQWMGVENAPRVLLATAEMPVTFLQREHGMGVLAMIETAGLYTTTFASLQYAFQFKLGKGRVHVGIQPGLSSVGFQGSKVVTNPDLPTDETLPNEGVDDPVIPTTDVSGNGFDLGAGVYFALKGWYVGLSGTHLLQPTIRFNETGYTVIPRQFYFMGGGNIRTQNALFDIAPALLLRSNRDSFMAEGSLRATYRSLFWLGAGYRYNDGVMAFLGIHIKEFSVGYSYDYSLSALSGATGGSHELFLRYNIKLNRTKKQNHPHKSIRIL